MDRKLLVHYSLFKLQGQLDILQLDRFLTGFEQFSKKTWFYQIFGFRGDFYLLVWNNEFLENVEIFISSFCKHTRTFKDTIITKEILWGITKPSIYTRNQASSQDIDPFSDEKSKFFIIYPFVKTADWYIMEFEARKEMMYEHIRIGKQYPKIKQLLVYSFGLGDQEFIVSYETDDLELFEKLVEDLRSSKARKFTLRDTPIIVGILRTKQEIIEHFIR
jgi:chlorite dismutase